MEDCKREPCKKKKSYSAARGFEGGSKPRSITANNRTWLISLQQASVKDHQLNKTPENHHLATSKMSTGRHYGNGRLQGSIRSKEAAETSLDG